MKNISWIRFVCVALGFVSSALVSNAATATRLTAARLYAPGGGGWFSLPNSTYQQQPLYRLYAIAGDSPTGSILNPDGGLNVPLEYGTHIMTFIGSDSGGVPNVPRVIELVFDGPTDYLFGQGMGASSVTLTASGSGSGSYTTADGLTHVTVSNFTYVDGLNSDVNLVGENYVGPGSFNDSYGTVTITLSADGPAYQAKVAQLQQQLADCDNLVAQLQAQLAAANASNGALSTQVAGLQSSLNTANAQAATLTAALASANAQLASANAQLAAAQNSLATANGTIAQLTSANQALSATSATQQVELAKLAAANVALATDLGTAMGVSGFTLPGATTTEQLANLVTAIKGLNHGQKQALFTNLGGKKK